YPGVLINRCIYADWSPCGGILERIREEIAQHLPQSELISPYSQVLWQILSDSEGLHVLRIKAGKDFTHYRCHRRCFQAEVLPATVNLGSSKNTVGKHFQVVTTLFNLLDPPRLHRGIYFSRMLKKQFDISYHCSERGPQFMAHIRNKLVSH